ESQSVDEVVTFIHGYGQEHRDLTSILKHPDPSAMVRWALPSPYWVKVNVGVGYSISNQKAVSDIIIQVEMGQIIGSSFRIHNLFNLMFMAEVVAVLRGLQFAQEIGFLHVFLEIDSRAVILKLQSKEEDYS
ncbi:hypothetical protein Gohar_018960, partial [Gossypium harknessii]|nr:hypothetical protein [Gossypium harknessii]